MIKTENVNTNVNESADFKCSEALVYVYQNDNKNNAALGDRRNSYVICERNCHSISVRIGIGIVSVVQAEAKAKDKC